MSIEEIYEPWTPGDGFKSPGIAYCNELHASKGDLRVNLEFENTKKVISIRFESPYLIRVMDEGDRLQTLPLLGEHAGETPFFMVNNSTLVQWFHSENRGIRSAQRIFHYAVYTANECIDVLTGIHPVLE
jgi:hypothetical protein